MSKIFRLYKEGTTTYEDWNNSPAFPYNSTSRDTIEDPDGSSARNEITSIPSPFARIDLVKTAFREVCKKEGKGKGVNLDGKTIFHKMVSDALDVAEIFFNIDKYQGKVEIIKWDPSLMLKELASSGIDGHAYLSDALQKFLKADAKTYNFDNLKNIYLLNYVQGPDELNIIGATSPATLFFSNANDLSFVNDIFFGEDRPFDSDYQPLYKRDFEFVKYLFTLRSTISNFAGLFKEVDNYLGETYKAIQEQSKKDELRAISSKYLDNLSTIPVVNIQQNDLVEVLGHNLYKKSEIAINSSSDFKIECTSDVADKPLVLPTEAGNRYSDLQYTTGKWGKTNAAPYFDEETDLSKRVLPFDGAHQPYLTISDFLEDTIIRVPHTLNIANYFDGNIKLDRREIAYLIPIKPTFFKYFSVEDLKGNMKDGRSMFEMQPLAGDSGVKVILRIPIKGNANVSYIEYSRIYYNSRNANINLNEGGMTQFLFTGFIMPQVRFISEDKAIYNVACIQNSTAKQDFRFFKGSETIPTVSETCRNEDQQFSLKSVNYLIEGQNFDYIQIRNNHGYAGLLIPMFKQQRNIDVFEFAIDLGTSNTHIEFRKGANKPEVFSFTKEDRQLCEMFLPTKDEYGFITDLDIETELVEKDYIPGVIGDNDFKFPTRTVLSCAKTVDWSNTVDPFTLVNLPFTYDKRKGLDYNNFKYNIKWGNGMDLQVMESYVRCLMLIIRNKVLLNNGNLEKTKITWFYPISMSPRRRQRLESTWDEAYQKYFGEGTTTCMTESAAPIQYFFKRYATATDLVNVDIGGGTTDIAFAKDREVKLVTSFRFASNALFEDSFSSLNESNGIVDWYKGDILNVLKEKSLSELINVFNSPTNAKPANMASFLFGLSENSIPKKKGVNPKSIDFNFILQEDDNFKIVFILFYTSIIYHIAQITKSLNLDVPRHISFSGNGSKVIRIITTNPKLLAKYTKLIFEKVLGRPYGKELEILGLERESNPKESTCKGGIICENPDEQPSDVIVFKGDCSGIVSDFDTYATISQEHKLRTVNAVKDFFDFTLNTMNREFNFDQNFGVSSFSLQKAREVAKKDLLTYLEKGITLRKEENESSDKIEETFFFYPIKGVLQAISAEIYNSLSTNF